MAQQVVRRQPGEFLTTEGRCIWLEFPQYHFFNLYFPNGGHQAARLDYKIAYYQEFFALITSLTPTKGVIFTGDVSSLKRFKDDVKEVALGLDCGLNIKGFNDLREGDIIESYEEIEVKKTL